MNAHMNAIAFTGSGDAAERNSPIDHDEPIRLPGEHAPEVKLDEDEERDGGEAGKLRARVGLGAFLARVRGGLTRRKPPKARAAGSESARADSEAVGPAQRANEEGARSSGAGTLTEAVSAAHLRRTEEGKPAEPETQPKRKADTRVLLGGVALAAVVAAVAGFALWPKSVRKPVVLEPGMLTQQPPLMAPAASLASMAKPEAVPAPEAPSKKAGGGDPLQEILALKPPDGPAPAKGSAAEVDKPAETASAPPAAKPSAGPGTVQKAAAPESRPEKSTAASPEAAADAATGEAGGKAAAKPVTGAVREPVAAEPGVTAAKPEGQGGSPRREAPPEARQEAPNPAVRLAEVRADTATLERPTQLAALVAHLSDRVNGLESEEKALASGSEAEFADLRQRMALAEFNSGAQGRGEGAGVVSPGGGGPWEAR